MTPSDLSPPCDAIETNKRNSSANDASLLDSLPPELFLRVFGQVYRLTQNTSMQISDGTWTTPYQLVCRRWRGVICSTPQFWQEIKVWKSPEWLEFSLTRCAGAPASVSVYKPTRPEETFTTLHRFASSIRDFSLNADVHDVASLSGLPSLLATPMPALESLLLDGPFNNRDTVDVPITHDLVPRLTTLSLSKCRAPRDTAVYTSLRKLTLFKSQWTTSYSDFLDVIRQCHELEYLSLADGILDVFAPQSGNPQPPATSIILHRLRTLKLGGHPNALSHLLATVHAPHATEVRLRSYLKASVSSPPIVTRLLASNPQVRYPFLSSPRAVSLTRWGTFHFQLSLRCGPQGNARLSIDHQMRGYEPEGAGANLQDDLVTVLQTFSLAAVDTLALAGAVDQISPEMWQRAFLTLPSLRTLTLQGQGALDAVWVGLARATAASVERRDDGSPGALCCPLLSEVLTDTDPDSRLKFSATPTLFEEVRAALSARAAAGGARLEKLKLYLQHPEAGSHPAEHPHGPDHAVLEDVRGLVGELDYREFQPL